MKYSKSAVILGIILCFTAFNNTALWHRLPPIIQAQQRKAVQLTLFRGVYGNLTLNLLEANNSEQWSFLRDLLEGLVIYDPAGNVIPAVAEKWQSSDNQNWLISLRTEAKWSNGEGVTAFDFVSAWQQLALSDSPLKSYLGFMNLANADAVINKRLPVDQLGVKASDEHTLKLILDKPTPYLPQMLAHIALLPHYFGDTQGFVGNGAYQFAGKVDNQLYLKRNPYYWRADKVYFKRVNYRKIDVNQPIRNIDLIENMQQKVETVQQFPKLCSYFYEFNFNHPLLKERTIRKALVSMVSSNNIVSNEKVLVMPTHHFLPQNMQVGDENNWSPVIIETLLQQYKISEKNPLILHLSYEQDSPHVSIANRLIRAWSQSDLIHIKAEPMDKTRLSERRAKGDFDIIRSGWCADYNDPMAFLSLLYSHSPDNKMNYHNKKVDELLEQALSAAISTEDRTTLYQQIAQIASEDFVFLPIFQYITPVYIAASIQGYQKNNPTGVIYSKDLYRQ